MALVLCSWHSLISYKLFLMVLPDVFDNFFYTLTILIWPLNWLMLCWSNKHSKPNDMTVLSELLQSISFSFSSTYICTFCFYLTNIRLGKSGTLFFLNRTKSLTYFIYAFFISLPSTSSIMTCKDSWWHVEILLIYSFWNHFTNIYRIPPLLYTQGFWTLIWFKPQPKRPQGCVGCQNDQTNPMTNPILRFCANFQPKLSKW